MRVVLILLIALNLFASEYKTKADVNLYTESYDMEVTKLNLSSIYTKVSLEEFNSGDSGKLRLSGIGNFILDKKDEYNLYKLGDSEGIITNASYEYIFSDLAFSVGRNKIDYPLLRGSFDGALAYWIKDRFSGKIFWFENYEVLYPSYYKKFTNLGLGGASIAYRDRTSDANFYLFKDKRDATTLSFNGYKLLPNSLEVGVDAIGYYPDNNSSNESMYKIYGGYVTNKFNIQAGYIKNSSTELDNIYRYGKSRINQFGLGNMLYLPNSENGFISARYRQRDFYTQLVFGETTYDTKNFYNLRSQELNLSFVYRFNKQYKVYGSYIKQEVDKLDDIYRDISLFTMTLNVRFR